MKRRVLFLGSARAKALITLAETGVECASIPDVFPLLDALVNGYSLAISSRLNTAQKARSHAQAPLDKCQARVRVRPST